MTETRSYSEQRADTIATLVKDHGLSFAEAEARFDASRFADESTATGKDNPVLEDQKLFDFIVANGHTEAHAISEVNYTRRGRGNTEPFVPATAA